MKLRLPETALYRLRETFYLGRKAGALDEKIYQTEY